MSLIRLIYEAMCISQHKCYITVWSCYKVEVSFLQNGHDMHDTTHSLSLNMIWRIFCTVTWCLIHLIIIVARVDIAVRLLTDYEIKICLNHLIIMLPKYFGNFSLQRKNQQKAQLLRSSHTVGNETATRTLNNNLEDLIDNTYTKYKSATQCMSTTCWLYDKIIHI